MKIVQSGVPAIVAGESSVTGQALAAELVTPQPLTNSFSGLMADLLRKFASAAVIIIDPTSRKITAASGADGTALREAAEGSCDSFVTLSPDAGQSGTSLLWDKDAPAVEALTGEALSAAIDAQRPKRSVSSLVSAILGADLPANPPVIVIDQVNGVVKLLEGPSNMEAIIDGVANAGDRIQIELSDDSDAPGAPKLIFEGGES